MFTVDKHLDSYSWKDFKNRKKWLYRKYKGTAFRFNADDTIRLSTLNSGGYSIDKYPKQPIDNEYQYYRGFGGRPAQREVVYRPSTGEYVMEPFNYWEEHTPNVDKRTRQYVNYGGRPAARMATRDTRPDTAEERKRKRLERIANKPQNEWTESDKRYVQEYNSDFEIGNTPGVEVTIGQRSGRPMIRVTHDVALYRRLNGSYPPGYDPNQLTQRAQTTQTTTGETQTRDGFVIPRRTLSLSDMTREEQQQYQQDFRYLQTVESGDRPYYFDEEGNRKFKRDFDYIQRIYWHTSPGQYRPFEGTATAPVSRRTSVLTDQRKTVSIL